MADESPRNEDLFPALGSTETNTTEVESMCMYCMENGTTKFLLTRVPHFRELVISSFTCDHCGFEDRSIQSGGSIQDRGVKHELTVRTDKDMDRQVVKSEWASLFIPEVDFEQPAGKRGEVNTVEGTVNVIINGLSVQQPARREQDPETAEKIDAFIFKLTSLKLLDEPFTFIIDDPSGNSYIENPHAPEKDPNLIVTHYTRTATQERQLTGADREDEENEGNRENEGNGENEENEGAKENGEEGEKNSKPEEAPTIENTDATTENVEPTTESVDTTTISDPTKEVLGFQTNCPECNVPCETNMKLVDIPFFKQVIIMATTCDSCGYRENEVRSGSGIEPRGKEITLRLTDITDLSRDVLKSDTCGVQIPELEFELVEGTLGGRFTTIEGLLTNVRDQLSVKNPFIVGDSAQTNTSSRVKQFCDKLQQIIDGKMLNIHIILDDPAGNSYIQNVYAPEEDPEMKIRIYERSFSQNEELGLNDMKTENYTQDS